MAHTHYRSLPYTTVPGEDLFSLDRLVYFDAVDVRSTAVADLRFYTPTWVPLDWMNVSAVLTGSTVTGWVRIVLPSQLASAATTDELIRVRYGGTPDLGSVAPTTTLSLSGLAGAWDMESASPADWSGNGNDATGQGGIGITTGKLGQGLNCDGSDDYLLTPTGLSNRTITAGCCAESWIWLDATGAADYHGLYGNNQPWGRCLVFNNASGNVLLQNGNGNFVVSAGDIRNAWHHLAYIYDSSVTTESIYLDGTAIATQSRSGSIAGAATQLRIADGYPPAEPTYNLQGKLDDMRFYDRAVTAEEIAYRVSQANPLNSAWGAEVSLGSTIRWPWQKRRQRRMAGVR